MALLDSVYPSQNPADAEGVKLGAQRIRELKDALQVLLSQLWNDDTTLKSGAVATGQIADSAVTTGKLADSAVTTVKIADTAVTLAKLASGTQGYLITFNSLGRPVLLPLGTAGKVVSSDGTDLVFVTPLSATDTVPISSNSPGANATATGLTSTLIGTCNLTLPAGKTWRWARIVFSTEIASQSGSGAGIGSFVVKIGSDAMTWVRNVAAGINLFTSVSNDIDQVTFIAEGVPTSHTGDATLTVDLYATTPDAGHYPDTVAKRSLYVVAQAA